MSESITYKELEKEFKKICEEFGSKVNKAVDGEVQRVSKLAKKELKKSSPKDTGAYSKDWKIKATKSALNSEAIVYNKKHYSRTHLLENGHLTRDGHSRVEGKAHIKPVNDKVMREFYKGVISQICK